MDRIGILIKKASLELEKTALSILSRYDMTLTQYKIIVYLYNALLHTLEKKDLICRAENAEDRHSKENRFRYELSFNSRLPQSGKSGRSSRTDHYRNRQSKYYMHDAPGLMKTNFMPLTKASMMFVKTTMPHRFGDLEKSSKDG